MRKILLTLLLLMMTLCAAGQNDSVVSGQDDSVVAGQDDSVAAGKNHSIAADSISLEKARERVVSSKPQKKFIALELLDKVSNFFMRCDTNYVTPNKYQFTAQAEVSYWHDFYHLQSSETKSTMTIQSDPSMVVGGFLYYSILGYGLMYNVNELGIKNGDTNGTSRRQTFNVHTAKFFAEYYTFQSGKGAKITHVTGMELTGKDRSFKGLDSKCNGFNAVYMFNNKHFSWPAAFGESSVQRRSCGSWSLGFQYNHQDIHFNDKELPDYMINHIDSTLLFNRVDYHDYSISIGYNYNCVLGRNCLFAFSIMPNIGYRRSNITEAQNSHSILNNLSTDVNFRSSMMWNSGKYFTGLILELHTYSYRKDKFGLTNTYGTLKYVMGLNFLRKR